MVFINNDGLLFFNQSYDSFKKTSKYWMFWETFLIQSDFAANFL